MQFRIKTYQLTLIWIFMSLMAIGCMTKRIYEVEDTDGNNTKLTLYLDSTFEQIILKEPLELKYEGIWKGGLTNGDTLITTATDVNNSPLSNFHISTYYITDEKAVLINFMIH